MLEIITLLSKEVEVFHPKSEKELEDFRIKYLGKKGKLNALFKSFKNSPKEEKN